MRAALRTRHVCSTRCERPQSDHVDTKTLIELVLAQGKTGSLKRRIFAPTAKGDRVQRTACGTHISAYG